MSLNAYTIWVDGQPYGGESEEIEEAPATTGQWWTRAPETRNRLLIGNCEARLVEGWRNLGSHLERILARHRSGSLPFTEITIRREA
jgi:hypothetical protein